jgi:Flp pilus assembly protein TadD
MNRKLIALACVFAASAGGPAWSASCATPYDQTLDQARTLRMAGKLDQAKTAVQTVLKTDPNNLRAKYTAGLIEMDQSDRAQGKAKADLQNQGMASLLDVSKAIQMAFAKAPSTTKDCLKSQDLFTVDNTLGSYYLRAGNINGAAQYLKKAQTYDQAKLLNQESHAKVSSNLGHLYYFLGDNNQAVTYLNAAKTAGDKNPAVDNTLSAIKASTANRALMVK